MEDLKVKTGKVKVGLFVREETLRAIQQQADREQRKLSTVWERAALEYCERATKEQAERS
jgi:hypothetical protein